MKKLLVKLIVVLLIVEISLRALGFSYNYFTTRSYVRNDKNRMRIVCLGESTTFGLYVRREESYPHLLNDLLQKKYPGKFLVINRGVPGITSSQILLNLNKVIKENEPDFVILLCGANEFNPHLAVLNSLIVADTKYPFLNQMAFNVSCFFKNLRSYKLIMLIIDSLKYKIFNYHGSYIAANNKYKLIEPEFKYKSSSTRILIEKQYAVNIDEITKGVRKTGAKIMYTTHLVPAMYENIKAASVRNGVVLCDQTAFLRWENVQASFLLSEDGFHPNAAGHRAMAKFLFRVLEESFINGS